MQSLNRRRVDDYGGALMKWTLGRFGQSIPALALSLPVVGLNHPLRLRYRRFMYLSIAIAVSIHLIAVSSFMLKRSGVELPPDVTIVEYVNIGVPPSIANNKAASQIANIAEQLTQPVFGVPKPVYDHQALHSTIVDNETLSELLNPVNVSDLDGPGGPVVIEIPEPVRERDPTPDEFVAVEQAPVMISMPSPIYPDMARQAEVQGTVMIRALVGKDGKVHDAFVVNGIPMLNTAALEAANRAIFKPALQQHKPVAVWVQIPMRFVLN